MPLFPTLDGHRGDDEDKGIISGFNRAADVQLNYQSTVETVSELLCIIVYFYSAISTKRFKMVRIQDRKSYKTLLDTSSIPNLLVHV